VETKKQKVRFSIGFKLISIFAILVILVLGMTTYMVSTLVRNDEQVKAEENNQTINGRTAETVQTMFVTVQNNAAGLFNTLMLLSASDEESAVKIFFDDYCRRNADTVFISGPKLGLRCNDTFVAQHNSASDLIKSWLDKNAGLLKSAKSGTVVIKNISQLFQTPVICILFPYSTNGVDDCVALGFKGDTLANLMSTGSYNTSFLINKDGELLVDSDYDKMIAGQSCANLEAVQDMMKSNLANGQTLFPDQNGEKWFYAYKRIAGGMLTVTCVSEKDVFEAINRTTRRIILFSAAVFFLAIIIILFFSKTLTRPIGELVDASHEIEQGQFAIELKPKTHDEIGVLTSSFIDMGKGLAERERLMSSFSKFTNKEVAERAAKGELKLGGETRVATIFFSDIRSFTAMSEKMQPYEIVEFLNDYMTRMVQCVNKTGGTVDKFIGDAIMVEWGVPTTAGNPALDAWNAIKTALMMRYTLVEFNKERAVSGKSPVRIGCGINSGDVVAGQIGSSERMEYTVIGDAVNFASRTESLNKPFATDILVTENTYVLIKDKVVAQEMPSVTVKGKEKPVKMYAIINAVGLKGPQTIDELRTLLGVPTPDLDKVDTDAEEKKYKIGK
jgi:adenylate cyclase